MRTNQISIEKTRYNGDKQNMVNGIFEDGQVINRLQIRG